MPPLVRLALAEGIATLTLARPERHNSLVPELVEAGLDAVDRAAKANPAALVLQAEGRSFSTGGDVAGFFAVPQGHRRAYADRLVGGLNKLILALLDFPAPVLGRVQGPVTGGSLGLVLACDLVAVTPAVFFQPYYVEVGFGPDGGWTAMVPERIGHARAGAIQLLNARVPADEAVALGLATASVAPADLDGRIAEWLAALRAKVPQGLAATRSGLMPPARRAAIAAGLEAEKRQFLDLIDRDETHAGMARFLGRLA